MELQKSSIAHSILRRGLPAVLGAAGGFGYYYFIGCTSGASPITSSPWASTAYGALLGFVAAGGWRPEQQSQEEKA
jgi:hypothetical protein